MRPSTFGSFIASTCLLCTAAHAQTTTPVPLPPQTRLVAAPGAPGVTTETFEIDTAQDLTVTLTDLKVPAALSSATVVISQGSALVANAALAPPAATAAVNLTGATGNYTLRVFGAPGANFSTGTFTVCVAPKTDPSNCIQSASLAGNITAQGSSADPTVSTLSDNLTVTTSGSYTVTFADDQFPVALNSAPNLALFQGSAPVSLGIHSGDAINLSPGTYTLLAVAQADQTVKAGLYGIKIAGPSGVPAILDDTFAVGVQSAAAQPNNPSAQLLTLSLTDFSFPAALATSSALVTAGSAKLGLVSAGGAPVPMNAPAGQLKVWSYATPGSDAGTYEVDVNSAGAAFLQLPLAISNGNSQAFAYLTPSLSAGSYTATASDFQFPANLQGLQFAVVQNAVILGSQQASAGPLIFTATAAPAVLLVNALTPSVAGGQSSTLQSSSGLFDINLTDGSSQLLFDQTQAVSPGNLFDSQTITFGASGHFDVTLADLKFPAAFQDLALVVSSGGTILGKIYGGGTFSINAIPGNYELTFIATPASQEQYGMYGAQIVYTAPTATLTATPTSVAANTTTTLSWTTTDAVSCTAEGGTWVGSKSVGSGSESVQVSANTTYTLSCTGPGGSVMKSVSVTTTTAPSSSSGGGGGGLEPILLMLLGLIVLARAQLLPRR